MAVILGAVLALVPFLIAPGLLFYFDVTPKAVVLLLGVAAALPWFAARGARTLAGFPAGRWFCALLAAEELSLLLSTVLSTNVSLSVGGTNWRRMGLFVYTAVLLFAAILAAWLRAHPEWRRPLLRVVSAAGLAAASYGILQYFGLDPLIDPRSYHVGEGVWMIVRPPGTLGHADYFAVYLVIVTFIALAVALEEDASVWRALGWTAAGVCAAAVVLSGTRAAVLGLVAGAVLLLICLRSRVRIALAVWAFAGFAVGAVWFYNSAPGTKLRARVHWSLDDAAGGARLLLWRDTARMAAHRWPAGYGPETFSSEFPRFQSVALARAYPDFYHESPHNILLDSLAGEGILGLLALLGLYALGFRAAFQARAREPALAAALASGLLAAFAGQQFTSFVIATALYSYSLIAVLVALEPAPERKSAISRQPSAIRPPPAISAAGPANSHGVSFTRSRWGLLVAVPVALLFAIAGIRILLADHALALASGSLDAGEVRAAVTQYDRSRHWQVAGAGSDLWYSRRLAVVAQHAADPARLEALRAAFAAAVRAPGTADDRQNAWYNLAALYAGLNDYPRTESSLRAAIACAPMWFKPHWMLAQVLRASGRLSEAEGEAALAADLNGGRNAEVAETLKEIHGQPH